jgi:hypothetical protein
MQLLSNITWEEIFHNWEQREASNPNWIELATEEKGWESWQAWRNFSMSLINASARKWNLYTFTDPINEIPNMLIGPYGGWQSKVDENQRNKVTFLEILNRPEIFEFYNYNQDIQKTIKALPFPTQMIGLMKESGKIICLEGHHRSVAVTIAKLQNKKINFGNSITIAIAKLPKEEEYLINAMLKRGSSKNPKEQS